VLNVDGMQVAVGGDGMTWMAENAGQTVLYDDAAGWRCLDGFLTWQNGWRWWQCFMDGFGHYRFVL